MTASNSEERVLVLAPIGRDASVAVAVLSEAGIASEPCPDIETLCGLLTAGAGAALLTEEALSLAATRRLLEVLSHQPPWSDLPLVVLTSGGETTTSSLRALEMLGPEANVTLLERPVRRITLVKTVQMALRGRRHQYEVRDHLAAREQLRLEAEAANSAKDEFLAMLSHELRNPLSAVRNAVATARLDANRRERALDIAHRQTAHLARLMEDLLEVARVTQGKITLHKECLHLADIIDGAVEATRSLIEERGHKLSFSFPPGDLRVEADPARAEQIVVNLLTNAAKYTKPGGRIAVTVERQEEEAVIQVRDSGMGIAPDMLPRVFDLFMQSARTLDRALGGLGVGLTVARRLVELHGGRIEAHSEGIGKGAEFVVRLPALPAAPEEAIPARDFFRVGLSAEPARQGRARVMLVEDNRDTAESLAMLLELLGHQVRVVTDGRAALDVAQANVPDVMLIDIGLPDIDGYEVARRMRQHPGLKSVVLIALTGYGRDEDRQRAFAAGFDYHIVKPVNPDALQGLVARLGKKQRQDPPTIH
jgi:signal transduction histidine kinase/CheY-like chemotaxis protein